MISDPQHTDMTCSSSDQPSKDIASSFIGSVNTIRNHKGSTADMVCDQSDRDVFFLICMIDHACSLTDFVTDRTDCIHIKNRINALGNNSKTL